MKTIGLIGGMSWESTAHYYENVNQEIKNRQGGLHSARCLLYSLDFDPISAFFHINCLFSAQDSFKHNLKAGKTCSGKKQVKYWSICW